MGRFHLNDLPKERRIQMIAEFYDVINSLENRGEVRLFFKDLLTGDEIATLMRRIEVAALLSANYTYDQISEILGVGKGKINNVQRVLSQEGNGYKIAIERLLDDRKRRLKTASKYQKDTTPYQSLKRRYSSYFFLNNLINDISESISDDPKINEEALLNTPSFVSFREKGKDDK